MRKKLRLDDLVVESFEAGEPTLARGTVRAHQDQTNGANCSFGCSIDENWSCPCATLAYQFMCVEVTNTCVTCAPPC
jgi:hypothetical protein